MFIAETYKNKLVIILAICILGITVNFSFAEQSRKHSRNNNIEVSVGQSFMIMLESNATTGFKWQLANTLEKNTLELVGTKYIASESNLIGAGGKEEWTFRAVGKGSATIILKYIRPWEVDNAIVQEETFNVIVR